MPLPALTWVQPRTHLTPPPNPNKFDALAARGLKLFERESCVGCHPPPLYTNSKLTLAAGFTPPADHIKKYDILNVSVGTNPNLALRRGAARAITKCRRSKACGIATFASPARARSTRIARASTRTAARVIDDFVVRHSN